MQRVTANLLLERRQRFSNRFNVKGLYPAGEGAGFAGGILSAGVDGIKVAEAVAQSIAAVREALPAFERQIKGFSMADAVLTGVETRTSSPVRITRGDDFQSLNTAGLFPAGEGAGYAGGILSAAVDGIKVAEALGAEILK